MEKGTPNQDKNIQINIIKYEQQSIGSKQVVFYNIEIAVEEQRWMVQKRYSELRDMHYYLKTVIGFLPEFPSKSFLKLKGEKDLDKRKRHLETWMKGLMERKDVFAIPSFITFFEVRIFLIILLLLFNLLYVVPYQQARLSPRYHEKLAKI